MSSHMRNARPGKVARMFLLLLIAAVVLGCRKTNDLYCEGHPDDPYCFDAAVGCNSSSECKAPSSVCKMPERSCVQCTTTEASACTGNTPVCSETNACRGCQKDDECQSQACDVQGGSCLAEASLLYVAPAGSGAVCTRAQPCGSLMTALGLVDATRTTIKMLPGSYTERVTIADKTVTVHAVGAELTEAVQGEIVHVEGSANVTLIGLRIHDGLGATGDGILCINAGANIPSLNLTDAKVDANGGKGVNATRCLLSIARSTIGNNTGLGVSSSGGSVNVNASTISKNTGGGITLGDGSTFVIVGNMFFGNGSEPNATTTGGISISTTQSAANRLEFNSFNKNQSQNGIAPAIHCFAGIFTARNNIISGNGTAANTQQVDGSCTHAYSIVTPGTLPAGGTNFASDPKFVDTLTGNLHIQPGSAAIRAAAPDADLGGLSARDLDGDARVAPADIGADELPR